MKRLLLVLIVLATPASAQMADNYIGYRNPTSTEMDVVSWQIDQAINAISWRGIGLMVEYAGQGDMFILEESSPVDRFEHQFRGELHGELGPLENAGLGYWHHSNGKAEADPGAVVADSSQSMDRAYITAAYRHEQGRFDFYISATAWWVFATGSATEGLSDLLGFDDVGGSLELTLGYMPEGDERETLRAGVELMKNQINAELQISSAAMVSRLFDVAAQSNWSKLYTMVQATTGKYDRIGTWGDPVKTMTFGLAFEPKEW